MTPLAFCHFCRKADYAYALCMFTDLDLHKFCIDRQLERNVFVYLKIMKKEGK